MHDVFRLIQAILTILILVTVVIAFETNYNGSVSAATVAISADESRIVMGVYHSGYWQTDDYGVTWRIISDDVITNLGMIQLPRSSYVIDASADTMILTFDATPSNELWQVSYTVNGGEDWQVMNEDIPAIYRDNEMIVDNANHNHLIYNSVRALANSYDFGETWDWHYVVDDPNSGWPSFRLFQDPLNDSILYVSGTSFYSIDDSVLIDELLRKSTDYGHTWQSIIAMDSLVGAQTFVLNMPDIAVLGITPTSSRSV